MVPRIEAATKNRAVLDQSVLEPVSGLATGGVTCACSAPTTSGCFVDGCAIDGFLVADFGLCCLTTARFLCGGREIWGLVVATLAGAGVYVPMTGRAGLAADRWMLGLVCDLGLGVGLEAGLGSGTGAVGAGTVTTGGSSAKATGAATADRTSTARTASRAFCSLAIS